MRAAVFLTVLLTLGGSRAARLTHPTPTLPLRRPTLAAAGAAPLGPRCQAGPHPQQPLRRHPPSRIARRHRSHATEVPQGPWLPLCALLGVPLLLLLVNTLRAAGREGPWALAAIEDGTSLPGRGEEPYGRGLSRADLIGGADEYRTDPFSEDDGDATDDQGGVGGDPEAEDRRIREAVRDRLGRAAAAGAAPHGGGAAAPGEGESDPRAGFPEAPGEEVSALEDEMTFLRSLDYKQPPRGCGQVKAWSDYYGYGFIAPFCAGPDLFVHATEVHADPATGYRDLAVGEWVYYDLRVDDDGKAQAINVTGPDGAYVEGRRGGGIVIEEDDVAPTVTPKKKGVIRDFTESKYWSMEQAPRTRAPAEKVPDLPQPKVNWWED